MHPRHKEILARYFPPETLEQAATLIVKNHIQIKFTGGRNTKLGDYRPPNARINSQRITINGDLNPWFLYLVFLHELAHLLVWNKFQNKVSPHGQHWKDEFSSLLQHAVFHKILPEALHSAVLDFCKNARATFASHAGLWKALKSFDQENPDETTIEDLPVNAYFVATNGRVFKKEEKVKTRFRCFCLNNKRRYLFHPLASIKPIEGEHVL